VIASPNRTGKSSLVEALRCALVEWHHDSAQVKDVTPWHTDHMPTVTVEFEVGGQCYLLEKRFSKRKGGGAELYQVVAGDRQLLAESKEVTPRVIELLGIGSAKSGLAQLLWVSQGAVAVPAVDKEVGDGLRRQLGQLITEQDQHFRTLLWSRLAPSFTNEANALKGTLRSVAPLARAEVMSKSKQEEVARIEEEFAEIEALLRDAERLQQELAAAQAGADKAQAAVAELKAEAARVAAKRQEFLTRERKLSELHAQVQQLQADEGRYQEHTTQAEKAEQQVKRHNEQVAPGAQALQEATKEWEAAASARRARDEEQDQMLAQSRRVQTMRRLLGIQVALDDLRAKLERVGVLTGQISKMQELVEQEVAPSAEEIAAVQADLSRLAQLEAELRAAQLTVRVEVKQPVAITFAADDAEPEQLPAAAREVRREVRQHARVILGEVASVEVLRGTERVDLERSAAEQASLEQGLCQQLAVSGLAEVARDEIVPRLTSLASARTQREAELGGLRRELGRLAPEGAEALAAGAGPLQEDREHQLAAHPDLRDWLPTDAEVVQAEQSMEEQESALRAQVQAARSREEQAETKRGQAQASLAALRQELQKQETALTTHRAKQQEIVQRYGTAESLLASLRSKLAESSAAAEELEQYRLTGQEEAVDAELTGAETTLARYQRSAAQSERDLTDVQGQLKGKGSEELHARRCSAEQVLQSAQRAASQLAAALEAQRVLLELFTAARDESVNRAIEPVSQRLTQWLPLIHGPEHVQVDFGPDLGVKAFTIAEIGTFPQDARAVSYGEREQLAVLIRLAYGAALAGEERQLVMLDDPLAHADDAHHGRTLEVLRQVAEESLQVLILTCHPERFSGLEGAVFLGLQGAQAS